MKPHLPVRLFKALMAVMTAIVMPSAWAATTVTIPEGYTQVVVDEVSDVTAYSSSATDVVFLVDYVEGGLIFDNLTSSVMTSSADSWFFTSSNEAKRASLVFSDSNRPFYVSSGELLEFYGLADITISGNSYSSSTSSKGGAIYAYYGNCVSFVKNGDIEISGNSVSSSSSGSSYGGAICAYYGGLSFVNNSNVLFEKNYEKRGSTYCLRSIYMYSGSGDEFVLSAGEGNSITFHDSIYVGPGAMVNYNALYIDEANNSIAQTGDILFDGQ